MTNPEGRATISSRGVESLAILLFTLSLIGCPRPGLAPDRPKAIASVALMTLDGESFAIGAHRRDVLVVSFFATWCMPCLAEIPYLKQLDARPGVRVVAISVDAGGAQVLRPFRRHFEIGYPILLADAEVLAGRSPFGQVPGIPATFLLTRTRKVQASVLGGLAPARFDPLVAKALKAR